MAKYVDTNGKRCQCALPFFLNDKLKRCVLYEKIAVHFFLISKLLSKFAHLIRKTTH